MSMGSIYWVGKLNGNPNWAAMVKWMNLRPEHSSCPRADGHQCAEHGQVKFRPVDTKWVDGWDQSYLYNNNPKLYVRWWWSVSKHWCRVIGFGRRVLPTLACCNGEKKRARLRVRSAQMYLDFKRQCDTGREREMAGEGLNQMKYHTRDAARHRQRRRECGVKYHIK